ncbi:ADP-ribosylglycohydrolase family protein [Streptomyces roseolus]|uniref:ADP-ribosylglycohydrolase family protein n=1 Tax=Streptomyces roseolus TaxID=67358 RepID=UPI0016733C21|nr:ADP-ribosylglycohydrolase family protein [Streptomyces roseolus]GGR68818.1 hypothetical protein GCM10010282_71950 [Streptomyces roseolus]
MTETPSASTTAPPLPVRDSLHGLAFGDAFDDRWFRILRGEGEAPLPARTLPAEEPWRWTDDTAQALVLVTTVAGRGDIDTTCAIAGGVIAARTGVETLPAAWHTARELLPPLPGHLD